MAKAVSTTERNTQLKEVTGIYLFTLVTHLNGRIVHYKNGCKFTEKYCIIILKDCTVNSEAIRAVHLFKKRNA